TSRSNPKAAMQCACETNRSWIRLPALVHRLSQERSCWVCMETLLKKRTYLTTKASLGDGESLSRGQVGKLLRAKAKTVDPGSKLVEVTVCAVNSIGMPVVPLEASGEYTPAGSKMLWLDPSVAASNRTGFHTDMVSSDGPSTRRIWRLLAERRQAVTMAGNRPSSVIPPVSRWEIVVSFQIGLAKCQRDEHTR